MDSTFVCLLEMERKWTMFRFHTSQDIQVQNSQGVPQQHTTAKFLTNYAMVVGHHEKKKKKKILPKWLRTSSENYKIRAAGKWWHPLVLEALGERNVFSLFLQSMYRLSGSVSEVLHLARNLQWAWLMHNKTFAGVDLSGVLRFEFLEMQENSVAERA